MTDRGKASNALTAIGDALALLKDRGDPPKSPAQPARLPSLLEKCEAMVAKASAPAPVRSIHHFACTGGTLIGRAISLLPNVTLLSEIDPLSRIQLPAARTDPLFRPTDLIYGAQVALRPINDETAQAIFSAGLSALQDALCQDGRHLVIRDHAHSQFCTETLPGTRPTLLEMIGNHHPTRAIVTVRHPLDSYLSLSLKGWAMYEPDTIEEYAARYQTFLARYADVPIFRYEDFVNDPDAQLQKICDVLDLAFAPGRADLIDVVRLSGDSGRGGKKVRRLERRRIPDRIGDQLADARTLRELCAQLGYEEDW